MEGGPRWPQSGWAGETEPLCGCLVGAAIAVSVAWSVEAKCGRGTGGPGASSPGKLDGVAGLS